MGSKFNPLMITNCQDWVLGYCWRSVILRARHQNLQDRGRRFYSFWMYGIISFWGRSWRSFKNQMNYLWMMPLTRRLFSFTGPKTEEELDPDNWVSCGLELGCRMYDHVQLSLLHFLIWKAGIFAIFPLHGCNHNLVDFFNYDNTFPIRTILVTLNWSRCRMPVSQARYGRFWLPPLTMGNKV